MPDFIRSQLVGSVPEEFNLTSNFFSIDFRKNKVSGRKGSPEASVSLSIATFSRYVPPLPVDLQRCCPMVLLKLIAPWFIFLSFFFSSSFFFSKFIHFENNISLYRNEKRLGINEVILRIVNRVFTNVYNLRL